MLFGEGGTCVHSDFTDKHYVATVFQRVNVQKCAFGQAPASTRLGELAALPRPQTGLRGLLLKMWEASNRGRDGEVIDELG